MVRNQGQRVFKQRVFKRRVFILRVFKQRVFTVCDVLQEIAAEASGQFELAAHLRSLPEGPRLSLTRNLENIDLLQVQRIFERSTASSPHDDAQPVTPLLEGVLIHHSANLLSISSSRSFLDTLLLQDIMLI